MSVPARERSAFGQFQLNRSAIDVGVDYSKVKHASTGDMAEMLRDGFTPDDVAEAFGLSESTIRQRLITAGWSSTTGEPTSLETDEPQPRPTLPVMGFLNQPWVVDALCAQTDPEQFFPEKGGSTRIAKEVCASCFVQAECLDYALTTNERFGIWGGLSEHERRALKDPTSPALERTAS
jgi:WhiB family redox-sensing transcriptional regulator